MSKYVSLINWTEQAIKNYSDTVDRGDSAKKVAADMGGSVQGHVDAGGVRPDRDVGVPRRRDRDRVPPEARGPGNIRTKTMRTFESAEVERIIAKS